MLALLPGKIFAQPVTKLRVEAYTTANGLSSGTITSIIQDNKGFMWFGTVNGLNRFDGYRFTVYRSNPEDQAALSDNFISYLYEDSRKQLWVGTANGSVDLYIHDAARFIHVVPRRYRGSVHSIIEDKKGNIWITAGYKILRISEAYGHYTVHNVKISQPQAAPVTDSNLLILQPFIDSKGDFYIHGFYNFSKLFPTATADSFRLETLFTHAKWPPNESRIVEDTARHFIYMVCANQLLRFKDLSFKRADTLIKHSNYIIDYFIDRQGNIWYQTHDDIYLLHPFGHIERVESADPSLQRLLIHQAHLYSDKGNNIWFGNPGFGIAKYSLAINHFHNLLPGMSIHGLYGNNINSIFFCGDYKITIGRGQAATISSMNLGKKQFYNYTATEPGIIWKLQNNYIIKYNIITSQILYYHIRDSSSQKRFGPLFIDREGMLWFPSANTPYLGCFDTATKQFSMFRFPPERTLMMSEYTRAIIDDGARTLWLGTEQGLFSFNKQHKTWRHYSTYPGKESSDLYEPIISLCNDPRQPARYIWLGTKDAGLKRLDKLTGEFITYDRKHGVPDEGLIYGILPDGQGNLWLSSDHGLTEFNPATLQVRNFDKSDGLQDNEFNRYAAVRTADGALAFGGINGISYFYPDEIQSLVPPQVTLTGFRLLGKNVSPRDSASPLQKDIAYTDKLQLKHTQNVFTLEYAGLEYYKSNGIYYRYRLEGFDRDWVYAGKASSATYTNLEPGTYHFSVQSSYAGNDPGSAWSSQGPLLAIRIIPPWWRSWWFYLLAAAAVLSAVYALYRYRLEQLLRVERIRNNIARDLHDEIGSTLSTISIYANVALQHAGHAAGSKPDILLKKITENVNQVMNAMSDIVWSINTRNDDFASVLSRMREHAIELFEAHACALHLDFDDRIGQQKISLEKRRDLYLIYKEALNNIVKYAGCAHVWISMLPGNTGHVLTIKDDGRGFDMTDVRRRGNGLNNMAARAAAIGGHLQIIAAPGKGTTIILQL